ncbi:unnamed protein product, partial [Effrenium voratum]
MPGGKGGLPVNVAEPAEPAEPGSALDQTTVVLTAPCINMPFVKELLGMQGGQVGCVLRHGPLECDMASHCQAMLGYALDHSIAPKPLKPFASTEQIVAFRQSMPPLHPKDIKQATNLLAYGNGLLERMKAHGIVTLPGPLADLKRVMTSDNAMLFHTAPILSSVGAMLSKLDNGNCMPPLDQ